MPLTPAHIESVRASQPVYDSFKRRVPNRAELDAVRYLAAEAVGERTHHERGQYESAFFQGAWTVMEGLDGKAGFKRFWEMQPKVYRTPQHRAEAIEAFGKGLETGKQVFGEAQA